MGPYCDDVLVLRSVNPASKREDEVRGKIIDVYAGACSSLRAWQARLHVLVQEVPTEARWGADLASDGHHAGRAERAAG